MATPKELVSAIARETGVPEPTVIVHDRNLAEVGLRTPAMRGRGVSRVTFQDAANLIIAVAGSRNVKDSAATVREYALLPASKPLIFGVGQETITRGSTFGDALAALLEAVPASADSFSGEDGDWVTVSLFGPDPRAVIEIMRRGEELSTREYAKSRKRGDPSPTFADLQFISRFTQITIGHVGTLVAG
ncbi:hypothetical protein [Allomesorhizobium camelthorni]|uniref:Uncharacterized protein n=1 Tax=Allomesorhizobium camelthorni TaxID=475069 RepID=A0A6G4WJE7_9HYPH|nr:hypothetical protein [Mesorhizobium camelthorni]NGO54207.1 hypothetical protein [Mesorhizobium camelthorni]